MVRCNMLHCGSCAATWFYAALRHRAALQHTAMQHCAMQHSQLEHCSMHNQKFDLFLFIVSN